MGVGEAFGVGVFSHWQYFTYGSGPLTDGTSVNDGDRCKGEGECPYRVMHYYLPENTQCDESTPTHTCEPGWNFTAIEVGKRTLNAVVEGKSSLSLTFGINCTRNRKVFQKDRNMTTYKP